MSRTYVRWIALGTCFLLAGCDGSFTGGTDSLTDNVDPGAVVDPQQNVDPTPPSSPAPAAVTVTCPTAVASILAPAADQKAAFKYHAVGVQIYQCQSNGAGGYAWTFTAPRADLFNAANELVGKHFAGPGGAATPEWQHKDGSFVIGSKTQSSPGATANDIPQLLLTINSHSDVTGKFTPVNFIQRLSTSGGVAPTTPCDASVVGTESEQSYTADYYFYVQDLANAATNLRCGGGTALAAITCPATPAILKPGAANNVVFKYHAIGVQIYTCTPSAAGDYSWVFTAPRADLYNATNELVAKHFAGPGGAANPEWQHNDGSFATGSKSNSSPGATANDIPWLELLMTSHGGPVGKFSDITWIQRLSTVGGVAPTTVCDASTSGATSEQTYQADYYFYRRNEADAATNLQCGQ